MMLMIRSNKKVTGIIVQVFSGLLFIHAFISCTGTRTIARQAERILINDTAIRQGHIGISIYEPATGKYWYNHDADKYFIPASNTKLFTLYAGMKYLDDSLPGIGYTIIPDSNITCLYPTADPSFLDPRFSKQPVLDFLNQQKNLRIYTQPQNEVYGRGWAWDDFTSDDMIPLSTFPLYGNTIRINWKANDSVNFYPAYFSKEAERPAPLPTGFTLIREFGKNSLRLVPGKEKNAITPFASDWNTVTALLKDTLHNINQISLTQDPGSGYRFIRSQPLDSLFKPMMHRSDNYYAEQTLLMVGNRVLGRMDEGAMIDTLLKLDLKDVPQKPKWVDGSGLSRYNLFTPQSFIYILNKLDIEFGRKRITNILPTGGAGTLRRLFLKDSSFIFAKTGTLSNNCALSGFLVTKEGKWLIFSILANGYVTGATPVRRASELFLRWLRENY